jgi:hypothetical protein
MMQKTGSLDNMEVVRLQLTSTHAIFGIKLPLYQERVFIDEVLVLMSYDF